jgi:organic hydroperoxide reductase OsmC/OhrA
VEAVDPEEAFVAALSSCHMLWFLSLAAKRGLIVESYRDKAVGVMGKNAQGKLAMAEVTLRPAVEFTGGARPTADEIAALHHAAHEECFIASSVRTVVRCEPRESTF